MRTGASREVAERAVDKNLAKANEHAPIAPDAATGAALARLFEGETR